MNDAWHWPLVIASLIGVVMNIHRGLYSQAALMAVYVGLAIYGLIEWSRKP